VLSHSFPWSQRGEQPPYPGSQTAYRPKVKHNRDQLAMQLGLAGDMDLLGCGHGLFGILWASWMVPGQSLVREIRQELAVEVRPSSPGYMASWLVASWTD
jgi:hypothetical protein